MFIESVMLSNNRILYNPLFLLLWIFPIIRVSSHESALLIRWPKYCSFSFSISPSNEYSGLISFRIDWFDLLAVKGTLKNLLQHHSSKASILWSFRILQFQFSHSVVSDSLRPHESQHARPPCPPPTPRVHPNSYASSRWCHPAISSSVIPFSSCPPIPPIIFNNESTLCMRWPKYWSFSLSISPSN